ncbi:PAS and helix-turn-helix domain-containing protein [Pseudooceanicola sp.]|uniref:PAS and helix-turn-helix domain-containing protein n=1 Tax=Pseudooceanicola sp. TaxID=1914328 RepID=UPI00261CAC98|nr:PAS and helix-turn-helix domain-containing protein [Pseudooceanicola sp.]MDF1855362.1 PAS and helix-turn-helix domain-containing protein [Pseudooceanicola sp.]
MTDDTRPESTLPANPELMAVEAQKALITAFDQAPVGLVLTEDRIIRICNATFADLFGWPREALNGQSFRLLYETEQEFETIRDIGLSRLTRDGVYSDERMIRRRNGDRLWCRFRARTLTPDNPLARLVMSFAALQMPSPQPTSLTARERDVVAGLARGETSKEIAQHLGLSPRSVEDVRARLLRKFGVRNAAALLTRLTAPGISR